MKPIVTLQFNTTDPCDAMRTKSKLLRVDYANLKLLQGQLEAALNEVDSVHCDRIQRYL